MSEKRTHLELLRQIFAEAEVGFDEESAFGGKASVSGSVGAVESTTITLDDRHTNVDAYTGFYAEFRFDAAGKLERVTVRDDG